MKRYRSLISIIASICIFVIAQMCFAEYNMNTHYFTDPVYHDKLNKLRKKVLEHPDAQIIIIFGSSRTEVGLDAKNASQQLTAALHSEYVVFNFGVPGAGPLTQMIYISRIRAAGIEPRLAVLEVMPVLYTLDHDCPVEFKWLNPQRLSQNELLKVSLMPKDNQVVKPKERLLPVYQFRSSILSRLDSELLPWQLRNNSGRICDDWGWNPILIKNPSQKERDKNLARVTEEYQYQVQHLKPDNRLLELIEDFYVSNDLTPQKTAFMIIPEGDLFRSWYTSEQLSQSNKVRLIPKNGMLIDFHSSLSEIYFLDSHHMLISGAITFTQSLMNRLVSMLEAKNQ